MTATTTRVTYGEFAGVSIATNLTDSENRANLRNLKEQNSIKQNYLQYPELVKFYEAYKCPAEIEQAIANGSNEYIKKKSDPVYRIALAQRVAGYFRDNHISLVDVPQKKLSSDMQVIVPRITGESRNIPGEHESALTKVLNQIGFWDRHDGNFIFDGKKVFIIDTENRSFYRESKVLNKLSKYDTANINIKQAHDELSTLLWKSKQEAEVCYPYTREEIVQGIIAECRLYVESFAIAACAMGIIACFLFIPNCKNSYI